MKKNLLGLFAVVAAIAFSAFTPKFATVYLVYDGTGPENDFANYSQQSTSPGTDLTNSTIWWFSVSDVNGIVTQSEFINTYFPAKDTDHDNLLSDQAETSSLEKKDF